MINFILDNHVSLTVVTFTSVYVYNNVFCRFFKITDNNIDYGNKLMDTYLKLHKGENK